MDFFSSHQVIIMFVYKDGGSQSLLINYNKIILDLLLFYKKLRKFPNAYGS